MQIEDDDSPGLDKLIAKLSSAQAKTTNTRYLSQLDFIEKFILGNKRIRNDHGWIEIHPDGKRHGGALFMSYINVKDQMLLDNSVNFTYFHKNMMTKLGNFSFRESQTDGGTTTRANAAFFDDPEEPNFLDITYLPHQIKIQIQNAREELANYHQKNSSTKFELSEPTRIALKKLLLPYSKTMSNIVGGVHNANDDSVLQLVSKLNFDPNETVLLECGCGAPLFAYQASIFTKQTICLDLPCVMKTVFYILSYLCPDDRKFAETLYYVSGFITLHLFLIFFS